MCKYRDRDLFIDAVNIEPCSWCTAYMIEIDDEFKTAYSASFAHTIRHLKNMGILF